MTRAAVLTLLFVLGGCSTTSTEPDAPVATAAKPDATGLPSEAEVIKTITERYGDCITALKASKVSHATGNSYISTAEGVVLTWNAGISKTGALLTFPADTETITALETVGC
jgi:hypothetical protein